MCNLNLLVEKSPVCLFIHTVYKKKNYQILILARFLLSFFNDNNVWLASQSLASVNSRGTNKRAILGWIYRIFEISGSALWRLEKALLIGFKSFSKEKINLIPSTVFLQASHQWIDTWGVTIKGKLKRKWDPWHVDSWTPHWAKTSFGICSTLELIWAASDYLEAFVEMVRAI